MAVVGYNTGGTLTATFAANNIGLTQDSYTGTEGIYQVKAYCRVDSGTTNVKAVVYADSAGEPAALLAVSAPVAVSNITHAWITFVISPDEALTTGDYWIGVVPDAQLKLAYDGSVAYTAEKAADSYASPTDPWPGFDSKFTSTAYSIYADTRAAGATITASDATARRGQTDYNFTLAGGDTTAGTATISDGVNTSSISITTYNANGVNTCTIPSTIACLYDATAVLTFTDAVLGTPTAAVSFQPTALNSYIDLVSPLATDDGYSMYHYTGAGTPITGWQSEWVTLTSPSSKTITLNADSGMILSSASTVNETANFYMINASGVRSAADLVTFQFVSGGAGSTSLGLSLSISL